MMTTVTTNSPPVILDWSDFGNHWGRIAQPCIYCGHLTNLRINRGWNAPHMHKVCIEKRIDTGLTSLADVHLRMAE